MKIIVGIMLVVVGSYAYAGDGGAKTKLAHQEQMKKENASTSLRQLIGKIIDITRQPSLFDRAKNPIYEVGDFVGVSLGKESSQYRVDVIARSWEVKQETSYAVLGSGYTNSYTCEDLKKLVQPTS